MLVLNRLFIVSKDATPNLPDSFKFNKHVSKKKNNLTSLDLIEVEGFTSAYPPQ